MGRPLAFLSDLLTSAIVMHLNKQTSAGKPSFPTELKMNSTVREGLTIKYIMIIM
jgi:hypothetical protein